MSRHRRLQYGSASLLFAACCAALAPTALARNLDFRFIDVEYIEPDVDQSTTIPVDGNSLSFSTDEDRGYRVAAAWELPFNLHVFGEYSKGENDYRLALSGSTVDASVSNNFDLTRGRAGIGYRLPFGDRWAAYARIT